MSFWDVGKELRELHADFVKIKVLMDRVEDGTKDNILEFKSIISDFDRRLRKVEENVFQNHVELNAKIDSLKSTFEDVYKQSLRDVLEKRAGQIDVETDLKSLPNKTDDRR